MSKKEHILDIAETLFNQRGYTAVGVDLIRDTAKVSKTSLYRHFSSKSKLIEAVLERRHNRFEFNLLQAVNSADDTTGKLDAFLDWHFQWFDQSDFKGCMFMHALAEFKQSEEDISTLSIAHKTFLKDLIISTLRKDVNCQENELFQRGEMIMTLVEGMIIRSEFEDTSSYRPIYRNAVHNVASAIL